MMMHSETLFDLNLGQLEECMDQMYSETLEEKVIASKNILAMSLDSKNIAEMANHDRLFGLLSRTLKDDFKKSGDLALYITTIFYIYSQFSEMHGLLSQSQIGHTSLQIIDYQLKKYSIRVAQIQ